MNASILFSYNQFMKPKNLFLHRVDRFITNLKLWSVSNKCGIVNFLRIVLVMTSEDSKLIYIRSRDIIINYISLRNIYFSVGMPVLIAISMFNILIWSCSDLLLLFFFFFFKWTGAICWGEVPWKFIQLITCILWETGYTLMKIIVRIIVRSNFRDIFNQVVVFKALMLMINTLKRWSANLCIGQIRSAWLLIDS